MWLLFFRGNGHYHPSLPKKEKKKKKRKRGSDRVPRVHVGVGADNPSRTAGSKRALLTGKLKSSRSCCWPWPRPKGLPKKKK